MDGNPFQGELDPYQGGASAVAESMRNVVAVGAVPWCLTDCLNYGNPEDPEVFRQFSEGVRGVGDAAREIGLLEEPEHPVPVVSGNVSFYNQSAKGSAIPPSPIVACFGLLKDYVNVVTQLLKSEGNRLWLVGTRGREMGGSAYWRQLGIEGGSPPRVDFASVRKELTAVHQAIEKGLVAACHDISEGGMLVAAYEMAQPSSFGLRMQISLPEGMRVDEFLLSEGGGFLIEADSEHEEALAGLFRSHGVALEGVGQVRDSRHLTVLAGDRTVVDLNLDRIGSRWKHALKEAMR